MPVTEEPQPRPHAERSEATRGRIVEATRTLFRERGYEAVSTSNILRAAGVSRGGLYHHFSGKDDVLLAVFEAVERDLLERLAQQAVEQPTAFAALRAGAQAYLDECLASEELQRIGLLHARRVLPWDVWREMAMGYGLGLTVETVRAAIEAGEMRGEDPEAMTQLIVAALIEAATMIVFADDQTRERERVGAAVDTLLEGLHNGS
ncbi:MAG: TetR/AcrR family transcriptional regulator [Actinomycetota bacterium]|nr:TetR/AcrR family transcriptional regulator [Actinomycetota bacterium]